MFLGTQCINYDEYNIPMKANIGDLIPPKRELFKQLHTQDNTVDKTHFLLETAYIFMS